MPVLINLTDIGHLKIDKGSNISMDCNNGSALSDRLKIGSIDRAQGQMVNYKNCHGDARSKTANMVAHHDINQFRREKPDASLRASNPSKWMEEMEKKMSKTMETVTDVFKDEDLVLLLI